MKLVKFIEIDQENLEIMENIDSNLQPTSIREHN